MSKLTLYHAAPSRSSIMHWMLEEVGEPYDLHLMSLKKGDNRAADYLEVNPMGKVPALRHGDVLVTEAAAICAYLAMRFRRPSSTCRRAIRGAGLISNGCSSARAASSPP